MEEVQNPPRLPTYVNNHFWLGAATPGRRLACKTTVVDWAALRLICAGTAASRRGLRGLTTRSRGWLRGNRRLAAAGPTVGPSCRRTRRCTSSHAARHKPPQQPLPRTHDVLSFGGGAAGGLGARDQREAPEEDAPIDEEALIDESGEESPRPWWATPGHSAAALDPDYDDEREEKAPEVLEPMEDWEDQASSAQAPAPAPSRATAFLAPLCDWHSDERLFSLAARCSRKRAIATLAATARVSALTLAEFDSAALAPGSGKTRLALPRTVDFLLRAGGIEASPSRFGCWALPSGPGATEPRVVSSALRFRRAPSWPSCRASEGRDIAVRDAVRARTRGLGGARKAEGLPLELLRLVPADCGGEILGARALLVEKAGSRRRWSSGPSGTRHSSTAPCINIRSGVTHAGCVRGAGPDGRGVARCGWLSGPQDAAACGAQGRVSCVRCRANATPEEGSV